MLSWTIRLCCGLLTLLLVTAPALEAPRNRPCSCSNKRAHDSLAAAGRVCGAETTFATPQRLVQSFMVAFAFVQSFMVAFSNTPTSTLQSTGNPSLLESEDMVTTETATK